MKRILCLCLGSAALASEEPSEDIAPADPYDADGEGEYTVRDAALPLPESSRMAAEVLLHVLSIRRLG